MATDESDAERAQRIKKYVERLRQQVVKSSPRQATRAFVKSENANERATGVIFMGALDDLEGLGEVITETKYPDTWDRAVVVVRHWLGRCPKQDQILYQRLLDKRGLKPVQAAGILQLLHSFGDADLAQPELYKMLVKFLDNDVLGIRGLAHWHLVRLVPAGKKFGFNPLDPKRQARQGPRPMEKADRRPARQGRAAAQASGEVKRVYPCHATFRGGFNVNFSILRGSPCLLWRR